MPTRRTGSHHAQGSFLGERREYRFARLIVLAFCRRRGRNALRVWLDRPFSLLIEPERSLRCRVFPSSMMGCQGLALRSLIVWWFVLAMVWVVVCWLRCWRKCRGFRQLREGSVDPPPPVRIGASAWADAMPRPASRLIRTVIIASARRSWETRCMKPKPLHQTPSGIDTACLFKFCPSTPAPHQIARANGEASRLLDIPPLFTLPPSQKNNTRPYQGHLNTTRPRLLLSARERGLILKLSSGDQPVFCRPAATPETVQRIR